MEWRIFVKSSVLRGKNFNFKDEFICNIIGNFVNRIRILIVSYLRFNLFCINFLLINRFILFTKDWIRVVGIYVIVFV